MSAPANAIRDLAAPAAAQHPAAVQNEPCQESLKVGNQGQ